VSTRAKGFLPDLLIFTSFYPLWRSFCVFFVKNHVSILGIIHFILCLTYFPEN